MARITGEWLTSTPSPIESDHAYPPSGPGGVVSGPPQRITGHRLCALSPSSNFCPFCTAYRTASPPHGSARFGCPGNDEFWTLSGVLGELEHLPYEHPVPCRINVRTHPQQRHSHYKAEEFRLKYPLEALGDERFQQVCQALLAREFPSTQCFPLNQADGGRDAISPQLHSGGDFIVFQVKYVVDPAKKVKDHKWLINTLKGESEKLSKLIPKGARAYVLLTNLPGTGHLQVGSIDTMTPCLAL